MALDTTLLVRNRVLGAKGEATPGTAQSLVAADCALFGAIFDPKVTPTIPPNERPQQQYLSNLAPIPGARMGKATWRSEVFGSGTAITPPTWATVLLPSCGFALATNVFTPFTPTPAAQFTPATIGLFQAGRLRSVAGAAGTLKISAKNGDPAYVEWDFTGAWQAPTTTAIPSSISYPTTKPPRFATATLTVGGTSYTVSKFELDMGIEVHLREDATNVTGYRAAITVARKPIIRIDPESLPLATQDWTASHLALTQAAIVCTIGSVAGNQLSINAPASQLLNPPQDGDRGGVMTDDLEFLCVGAADNDLTLTFL